MELHGFVSGRVPEGPEDQTKIWPMDPKGCDEMCVQQGGC